MTAASQILDRVRGKTKAVSAAQTPSAPVDNGEGHSPDLAAGEAEKSAGGKIVTRAEHEALIAAVGLALKELADGSGDAFFSSSKYAQRLEQSAEAATPSVKRAFKLLVKAISGHSVRSYGVDRSNGGGRW
jgi:hypothetical protein